MLAQEPEPSTPPASGLRASPVGAPAVVAAVVILAVTGEAVRRAQWYAFESHTPVWRIANYPAGGSMDLVISAGLQAQ